MRTGKAKRISEGRRGLVAILFSGFMLLALVFSISLASTRPETSGQQRPAVIGASVETPVEATGETGAHLDRHVGGGHHTAQTPWPFRVRPAAGLKRATTPQG